MFPSRAPTPCTGTMLRCHSQDKVSRGLVFATLPRFHPMGLWLLEPEFPLKRTWPPTQRRRRSWTRNKPFLGGPERLRGGSHRRAPTCSYLHAGVRGGSVLLRAHAYTHPMGSPHLDQVDCSASTLPSARSGHYPARCT